MNIKKRNLGFVRVAGTVLLAALVLTTSIWFTRIQLSKNSGDNQASVYYGGYKSAVSVLTIKFPTPLVETSSDRPEIKCKIFASGVDRIDSVKHPTLHRMLSIKEGYCGVYSFLLSMYNTFGIREMSIGDQKFPIASNKTDMNLDLIEQYVKTQPGLRDGMTNEEVYALYQSVGKSCVTIKYSSGQLEKQCKDLIAYRTAGYDCDLGLYGTGGAHAVNIKSASWSKSKNACVHKIYNTTGQRDPKIKPQLNTVTVEFFQKGYLPGVDYPEDNTYNQGADYICCK